MEKEKITNSKVHWLAPFLTPFFYAVIGFVVGLCLFAGCGGHRDDQVVAAKCLDEGNRHFENGDYDLAVLQFNKALAIRPDWGVVQENRDIALKRLDPIKWLEDHPEDDNIRLKVWSDYFNAHEFESAYYHAQMMSNPQNREGCMRQTKRLQAISQSNSTVCTKEHGPQRSRTSELLSSNNKLQSLVALFFRSKQRWPNSGDELMLFEKSLGYDDSKGISWDLYSSIDCLPSEDGRSLTLRCNMSNAGGKKSVFEVNLTANNKEKTENKPSK